MILFAVHEVVHAMNVVEDLVAENDNSVYSEMVADLEQSYSEMVEVPSVVDDVKQYHSKMVAEVVYYSKMAEDVDAVQDAV